MAYTLGTGILAGGKSSRMGQNKVLLQYENTSFLKRICKEMSGFSETIISAAGKGEYEALGYPVVYDEHREIGPIEGIRQILLHTSCDYVFICAGDMPFINAGLVRYMEEFISSDYDCYCLVDEEHIHPLCAIYSRKILPVLEELIAAGQYRLLRILKQVRTKYIRLEYTRFDKKVVRNINTREEYVQLALPMVFCVSGIKDSGKTGLIVKLINEFIKEDYSVGVIKHDGHDYVMDHPGTDTDKFREAGARVSAIFSATQYSVNCRKTATIEEILPLCGDVDIIILEGLKASAYPKIEVVRGKAAHKKDGRMFVCDPQTLIAIATDIVSQDEVSCPVYGLDDVRGIYLCLKKYFGLA